MVEGEIDGHAHQPRLLIGMLAKSLPVLPQTEECFMRNLLRDISIQDHEIDRADDERKQAHVERFERPAVAADFYHDIS